MKLKEYNKSELPDIEELIQRECWFMGERIKRDPRANFEDFTAVMNRVCEIITDGGFGEYLSQKQNNESTDYRN